MKIILIAIITLIIMSFPAPNMRWHIVVRDVYCVMDNWECEYHWSVLPRKFETLNRCKEYLNWLDSFQGDVTFICSNE
jgi:hypothetical protein